MAKIRTAEQILAEILYWLPDSNPFWGSVDLTYDHQYCFMEYHNDEIQKDKDIAKKWFDSQVKLWGKNVKKITRGF